MKATLEQITEALSVLGPVEYRYLPADRYLPDGGEAVFLHAFAVGKPWRESKVVPEQYAFQDKEDSFPEVDDLPRIVDEGRARIASRLEGAGK